MRVTMSLYRSIATAVGTREARDLAHRLAAWHDAMVMHRRRAGDVPGSSCHADCPHEEAESLWREAVETYGERAHELAFLRAFGMAAGRPDSSLAQRRVCSSGWRTARTF
jgi:hypothetical protein